jgi:hypothetical protein
LRQSFLKPRAYNGGQKGRNNKTAEAGDRAVKTEHNPRLDQRGFSTADILWAAGIWSVILCLSPVIVFYVLMVA